MAGYLNKRPDGVYWQTQYAKGVAYRKKYARENDWERWRRYYRGQWNAGILPVNVYYKILRTIVPRIYFRDPNVSISATKPGPEYAVAAKLLERLANKLVRRLQVKKSIKSLVQNAFMFGTGAAKIGYSASPAGNVLDQPASPVSDLQLPHLPWFESVPTGDFVVPAGVRDIHTAPWVAHRVRIPLDRVHSNPNLKNASAVVAGTGTITGGIEDPVTGSSSDALVDLVEFRDRSNVFIFPLSQPDLLLYFQPDDLMFEGKFPIYPLIFNEDDQVFWGVPDSQIIEPQVREKNETRTLITKHRRLSIVKFWTKRNALTPDEQDKMVGEDVAAVINVDGELGDVKEATLTSIPAGLLEVNHLIDEEIQEMLGLGVNQFGNYAPGSADRSATESRIVAAATQIRMNERRDMVADLLTDTITHILHIALRNLKGPQVMDIAGTGAETTWLRVDAELLRNLSYDVHVDPDTSIPETRAIREQRAIQVYGLLKSNPLVDPEKLTTYLLRQLHGTQFDDMIRGAATQQNPLNMQEFLKTLAPSYALPEGVQSPALLGP